MRKSYAGHTALTELTIGKFADHLPFYRQIAMFKRLGIELKQPTIEGWFFGIADLMRPMYNCLPIQARDCIIRGMKDGRG